ncbi:hypothetical protein HMI48_10535 [Acidithiobacillus ferrooxidans]|uniref:hypothetical protein n=1 Tax=Acidithiobacillus ferrooxidans TaxID=920 RepID=UPI001C0776EB|nr:hypothetical protein [Acidithiobacillus ferrooxidans]MBU2774299.1 hypothetical protein [Acidithiobacillus ferrooxidans]
MSHSALSTRDVRYSASRRYHPIHRRQAYDYEAARIRDRDSLIHAAFQPGDQAQYDFGMQAPVPLTIQSVTPHHILAVDGRDRTYAFGGVDAPCPGKWDADTVMVTTRLRKAQP